MQEQVNAIPAPHKRVPWNKGKVTGAKPPLRPKHVWSIRTKLQIEGRCACRKSNSHIQMMKSAKKWRRHNATNGMYCSRHRRVLVD
jgi:hypothetical protein